MITVNDAHKAWAAAFQKWHNIAAADAALAPVPLCSWKTEQFLMLAESVWQTIEKAENERLEAESEDDIEDDGIEEEAGEEESGEEAGEDSESDSADDLEHEQEKSAKATEGKEGDHTGKEDTPVYQDLTVLGTRFSHLLWQRAKKEPRLLVKLLWGIATEWGTPNVEESFDGDISGGENSGAICS